MRTSTKLLVAGLAVALFGGGIWALRPRVPPKLASPTTSLASAHLGVPAVASTPPLWQIGQQRRYQLDFTSELVPLESKEKIGISWAGQLTLTAIAAADGKTQLAYQFEGSLRGEEDPKARAQLEAGLKLPFYVSHDSLGRVQQFASAVGTPIALENAWKSLISMLEFLPSGDGAGEWTVEQEDPTGRYLAAYSRAPKGGGWLKQKKHYASLNQPATVAASPPTYEVKLSKVEFKLEPGCQLLSVKGEELLVARSQPPIPSFSAQTKFELSFIAPATVAEAPQLSALQLAFRQALPSTMASGANARMKQDEMDQGALANVSVPELFHVVGSVESSDDQGRTERRRANQLLSVLLRQHPERTKDVLRMILSGQGNRGELLEVLRRAGTPEAQDALFSLTQRSASTHAERLSAAQSLSMVTRPTVATVTNLKTMSGDPKLGRQAQYGLGTAARNLLESEPSLADDIIDVLLKRLAAATTTGEVVTCLYALGNAGHPKALGAIEAKLEDPTAEVRQTAIWALRLINGAAIDQILIEAAASPDAGDRIAAVKTLAFRPPSDTAEAVLIRLLSSDVPSVRQEVISDARSWLQRSPNLRHAFEQCASSDNNLGVKQAAVQALASLT